MIAEFALLPSIFESSEYASEELLLAYLAQIRHPFLETALVRNLRNGEWEEGLKNNVDRVHPKYREFLKKLIRRNRLRRAPSALPSIPSDPVEWGHEALESHKLDPLRGIIAKPTVADSLDSAVVTKFSSLAGCPWWLESCSPSRQLQRTTGVYLEHLRLFQQCANSLMFIDGNIDPSASNYSEFWQLLAACRRADGVQPLVEIHRKSYKGSGRNRQFPDWDEVFRTHLEPRIPAGLRVDVYIWSDFHDRYLISDLGGISVPYGFDVDTSASPGVTTWAWLSSKDRDNVQREFDSTSGPQKQFSLFGP